MKVAVFIQEKLSFIVAEDAGLTNIIIVAIYVDNAIQGVNFQSILLD